MENLHLNYIFQNLWFYIYERALASEFARERVRAARSRYKKLLRAATRASYPSTII